jgi:hypothetical protein
MPDLRAFLSRLIRHPSDFRDDPEGHVGNQSAHALLIGPVIALAGMWAGLPGQWPLAPLALAYGAWEAMHYRRGATLPDCVEDWCTVMLGAALMLAAWPAPGVPLAWSALACAIALGTWRRA